MPLGAPSKSVFLHSFLLDVAIRLSFGQWHVGTSDAVHFPVFPLALWLFLWANVEGPAKVPKGRKSVKVGEKCESLFGE